MAIAVLVLAAVVAIRLIFGFVAGIISAALWILVVVALVVAALWARDRRRSPRAASAAIDETEPDKTKGRLSHWDACCWSGTVCARQS